MSTSYYDEEAALLGAGKESYSYEFAERTVRQGFVRKVFGILGLQLLVTAAVTAGFMFSDPLRNYVYAAQWPFWLAFGLSISIVVALGCSESLRRSHPWNMITLAAFTLCEAFLIGTVSAAYNTQLVLLAVGITTVVVLGCAAFAMQSRVDLTLSSGALVSVGLAFMSALVLNLFIRANWLSVALCGLGVALFSLYLIFDVQLLMGGHKYALSPDEYVFAALNLYLDIINIFLYILDLLSRLNRD
ncbi:hypothetical protein HYH02_006499 [Chlamydomonas schloesseri]|uniref:Uncharacterized protein n=1 Tax=Chlamydomonas schloesseri TaxID=2026947 RepID=A0A836B627_9CHLO|nr:hypothetical protein HYH02_006499 [Chlamydomonas schloesseri]|eukprot:KAG2448610.1 hypothetical protein HYH02_006499 [Chlamydomonas schloesseri]